MLFYLIPLTRIDRCHPQVKCKNSGICIPSAHVCDLVDDCGDGSDETAAVCPTTNANCNFEKGWCKWVNWYGDDFNWLRGSTTNGQGTGPVGDHTTGSGQFLYIDSSPPRQPYDRARLRNYQLFKKGVGVCKMRLYYNMYGSSSMGILRVYLIQQNTNGGYQRWAQVWKNRGMKFYSKKEKSKFVVTFRRHSKLS